MGRTAERGYGLAHQRLRKQWAVKVDNGQAHCARCGGFIVPGTPWHLDHSDDRSYYLGPSHASCNDRAAANKLNRTRRPRLPRWLG